MQNIQPEYFQDDMLPFSSHNYSRGNWNAGKGSSACRISEGNWIRKWSNLYRFSQGLVEACSVFIILRGPPHVRLPSLASSNKPPSKYQ